MSLIADIQVIFLDDTLLVVNKPAGLPTLPDGYDPALPHIRRVLESKIGRLWIVHRLDKETSGVLLLARSAEAHCSLNTQFEQHLVSKVYHALVSGDPHWREKTVNLSLRANGDRRHRTVIDLQTGKTAITCFRVLERFIAYCFLEARPETGRTHQIRAHLLSLGLPILGDRLYAIRDDLHSIGNLRSTQPETRLLAWPADSIGLHARSLEISHPATGEKIKITAPYPPYFEAVLASLREHKYTS
jgi:tRNA pseudouridine32 synthase/23S rRNA pseudouridine746 synthase